MDLISCRKRILVTVDKKVNARNALNRNTSTPQTTNYVAHAQVTNQFPRKENKNEGRQNVGT